MITLPLFKNIDQSKPIQILLDDSGLCGCAFIWCDCEIIPDKDNALLYNGRVIEINQFQSLRNKAD